jgi:rhomboid family protein
VIPIGDFLRRRTTPYVNWALIVANIAIFAYVFFVAAPSTRPDERIVSRSAGAERQVYEISEADRLNFKWGFVSSCEARYFGIGTNGDPALLNRFCPSGLRNVLQVFTAMFLHGSWFHVLSNMLFLWIFGDNVEDRVGHGRYLVFYLLCGIGAALLQTSMTVDSTLPAVGASGAIAGVLAAYLFMYPTAIVQVVILPLFFIPFLVPAVLVIGLWFLSQLVSIGQLGTSTAGSDIAYWAHIGGFATGAVLIWFFKQPRRASRAFAGGLTAPEDT